MFFLKGRKLDFGYFQSEDMFKLRNNNRQTRN